MKKCNTCGEEKGLENFSMNYGKHRPSCRICAAVSKKQWYENNLKKPEVIVSDEEKRANRLENKKNYYKRNREEIKATKALWRAANKEKIREENKSWRANNLAKHNYNTSMYRARKLQATPEWADSFLVEEAYDLAKLRERVCGGEWHVDHIVPLNSKSVCGLHCEFNLQVIPKEVNLSKSNKFIQE